MPTYEYVCPNGHDFELFQKMADKPRAKCPVCGKLAVRQISGGAGLVFKGSGFYITDYGKDGKGPRKAESTGESSASPPSGGDKAESSDKAIKTDLTPKTDKPAAAEKPVKPEKPESASKSAKKRKS